MHIVGRVHHIPVRACDLRAHRACCRDRAPGRLDCHDRSKNARCGRRIGDRTSQGRGDADGHRAEGGFSRICRAAFASASAIGRRRAAASTAAGFGARRCRCGCESGSTCAGGGTAPRFDARCAARIRRATCAAAGASCARPLIVSRLFRFRRGGPQRRRAGSLSSRGSLDSPRCR